MTRSLAAALLCIACGSGTPPVVPSTPPKCSEAEINVLGGLFEQAALGVIATGKCDAYIGKDVSECPAYKATELSFRASAMALCRTGVAP